MKYDIVCSVFFGGGCCCSNAVRVGAGQDETSVGEREGGRGCQGLV